MSKVAEEIRTLPGLALRAVMRQLAKGSNDPVLRGVDQRIFRVGADLADFVGLRGSSRLREEWALDLAYVLANSIASTPPGKILQFTLPLILTVGITTACPFGCVNCYSDSQFHRSDAEFISLGLIRKISRSSIPVVMLTGGEPLIHPEIGSICEELLSQRRKVTLATNMYSAGLEPIFRSYPRRVTILLAVWGNEGTHDSIRGAGSLRDARERLVRYIRADTRCSLNLVIADRDATCLEEAEKILSSSPQVHRVFVTRAIHVGRRTDLPTLLSAADVLGLRKRCLALSSKFRKPFLLTLPELQGCPGEQGYHPLIRFFGLKLPTRCATGSWTMHIGPDGSCHGCFGLELVPNSLSICDQSVESAWGELRNSMRREMLANEVVCLAEARRHAGGSTTLRVLR
jgi:MoaA/NifB/PqqE/SkfB family radical SAM enzyme